VAKSEQLYRPTKPRSVYRIGVPPPLLKLSQYVQLNVTFMVMKMGEFEAYYVEM
jgi:hypothetical protein